MHIAARRRASRSEPLSQMGSLMSEQLRDDQAPGLTQALVSLLGDVNLLISDGHYKAAGEQLSLAVQTTLFQPAAIDRAVAEAEKARVPVREGPFGGYDEGNNNSQPEMGTAN